MPHFPRSSLLAGPGDAPAFVAERAEQGVDYVKIIVEVPGTPRALSQETLEAVVRAARERGLRTVAHASAVAAFAAARRAGVDAVTHVPLDAELPAGEAELTAAEGRFVVPTLAMMEAVAEALTLTDTLGLADRVVDELSGGQRQRVWIAMALAQGTDLLLLDEPTTYLDVAHQLEMLDLLAELNARRGTTIVMVLHDLNLSARYADHLVALRGGTVVAEGTPREVVTEEVVREVFGLDNRVIDDPVSHTPLVVPVGRHQKENR